MKVIQPASGYRAAIDPILLAAAVDSEPGAQILDVGCGTGAALFCLLTRMQDVSGLGLERHPPYAALAERGLAENGLHGRGRIVQADIAQPPPDLAGPFDVVMTNPPFYQRGTVRPHPDGETPYAVTELPLETWIAACLSHLKKDGLFAIIHRAERLADIIAALSTCGAVSVFPLWPKAGRPASRVVVTARKGRRSPATIYPGLVLHTPDDTYTPEAEQILRAGAPLFSTA